jgi:hypothetical protein
MPTSQLKRAERAIQAIRDQAELPPEAADALEGLVDVVGTMENRVAALEGKGSSSPNRAIKSELKYATMR